MQRLTLAAAALAALALPLFAAEDPIAARQALMSSNGAAAGVAGGMMKTEIPYSPAVAKSVIATLTATGAVVGDYFPEGSFDAAKSKAAEKIWTDRPGFDAELAKFHAATLAASEASGREGPADLAAFQAAIQPVFESCKSCHESYQIPD